MFLASKRWTLLSALLLAGCASGAAEQGPSGAAPAAAPRYTPVGLEGVLGRTAAVLQSEFGQPELDVREGSARKLQFGSQICVLDTYLYPPKAGGPAIVTHIDARTPDGRDIDRASCVAALQQKQKTR
jgi:hypothetical protein